MDKTFGLVPADTVLEALPGGVVIIDAHGAVVFANRHAEDLFGYPRGGPPGVTIEDLVPPELKTTRLDDSDAFLETPTARAMCDGLEVRVARGDGPDRHVHVHLAPFDTPQGRFAMAVVREASTRTTAPAMPDITDARYRMLAEASRDQIFIIGRNGRVEYVNPCAAEQFGQPPSAILGKQMRELFPTAIAERQAASLQQVFAEGEPIHRQGPSAFPDREAWLDTWLVPVRDDTGTVTAVLGVSRDLTEHRALERRLAHAQKLEAVGHLAGGIAHDFNNILTVIQGYTEMILQQIDDEKPISPDLREIQKATDRAIALTRRLLAFGRRQTLDLVSVDLNTVIRSTLGVLRRLIGEDIEVEANLRPIGSVKADVSQIEQILMNLASNARDAMPRGGKVIIETEPVTESKGSEWEEPRSGRFVCLRVRDSGVGMDAATQTQIFEPFFTTKDVGKGTGLGLSGVYGTVKQLGGQLSVRSAPGRGSTFELCFPETPHGPPSGAPEQARAPVQVGRGTVLLIEDEEGVRQLVSTVLTRHGYVLTTAARPSEALRLLQEIAPPALIISDVVMPEMSGPELVATLKRSWPESHVLYTSGYAHDVAVQHGLVETDAPLLRKPFTPRVLLERVTGILDE